MKAKSAFYIFGNIFYTYLGIIKDTLRNFLISLFHVLLGRRQEDVRFFEFRGTVQSKIDDPSVKSSTGGYSDLISYFKTVLES